MNVLCICDTQVTGRSFLTRKISMRPRSRGSKGTGSGAEHPLARTAMMWLGRLWISTATGLLLYVTTLLPPQILDDGSWRT
jgi:hypothetical protein